MKLTDKQEGLLRGIELCQGLIANYKHTGFSGSTGKLMQGVIDKLIFEFDEDDYAEYCMECQSEDK